ncbi:MAG: DNA polymerase IV [Dehalococcoidia bacterium]|nr:DNA polymerase IV [Dehalococcoidia bacterium]MDW8009544.1 DNA polymerase IV [Chloroflexota bacterium]
MVAMLVLARRPRPILHVDLDCFFAAAEVARRPHLRGQPVVVGGGPRGTERGVVCSATYEARALGVRTAMPLAQARRLCPQAVFLPADIPYYESLSRRFHAILQDYTPDVEPLGLDEAFLDLTGCDGLWGGPEEVAREIRRRVRDELSLTCSVGVASSKVVAKVASDMSKPDGLLAVPMGQEAAFLALLPVAALPGVGRKTEQALAALGVATVGDLARLPRELLVRRFGVRGHVLWLHARGLDPGPVQPLPAAKSMGREATLPYDVSSAAAVKAVLRLHAERIGARLREEGQKARCLTLKLRFSDMASASASLSLATPTYADQVLFEAACRLLPRVWRPPGRPVRLVGLSASQLVSASQLLLPLAVDGARDPVWRWESLSRWTDWLRQRHGDGVLQTGHTRFAPILARLQVR